MQAQSRHTQQIAPDTRGLEHLAISIWHLTIVTAGGVRRAPLHACPLNLQRRNRADFQDLQLQAARGCDSLDKVSTCANNSSGSDSAWCQADLHHGSGAEPGLKAGQAIAAVPICLAALCQARRMRSPSRPQSNSSWTGTSAHGQACWLGHSWQPMTMQTMLSSGWACQHRTR